MEQQFSTSKVTVEYFDPHDVYKLLAPGLVPRLPLYNLHWQSHAGPLRSIDTLHIELIQGGEDPASSAAARRSLRRSGSTIDDGFHTQSVGGRTGSTDHVDTSAAASRSMGSLRRHQIPGLRRTPYLKVLLVRCDDNEAYKTSVRPEVREWVKTHTPPSSSSKKSSNQENHDAFEWLIVHVVIPNTVAATQPRTSGKSDGSQDKSTSRWRTGSTPLLEKLRSDFQGTSKSSVDRIAQIRIGINDVPYDVLPRVVPAVPTGYSENEHDAEAAWQDLIGKFKGLILNSFDMRVTQYEDDIKEKDAQRTLPGWNFCTFFILKEGLARGFESVGLVEDALVGYDELSVGLDSVIHEQATAGSPERHGGAMLSHTQELKKAAENALAKISGGDDVEEAVDLQSTETTPDHFDEIPINSTKKAYRDMILANNVSVFDFRCYIFARQINLLLRLGNALSSREELLAKLKEQQESVLHGVAPLAPPPKQAEEPENLAMLAEICRRALQFIPSVSQIMRLDIIAAMTSDKAGEVESEGTGLDAQLEEIVDNLVASFAFTVSQQILAQTSSKALPIPPSTLAPPESHEQKASIPEPKTMMHPARTSSLSVRTPSHSHQPPPSPGIFPGPGMSLSGNDLGQAAHFLKAGLEDLAARRAELYILSRSILYGLGQKRGWSDGWKEAPVVGDAEVGEFEEVSLDDDNTPAEKAKSLPEPIEPLTAGIESHLLQTAVDGEENFYRLYEILTDKALRHYTVANHDHAVQGSMADLAVLKYHLKDYGSAASCFYRATPFFGESGWTSLELSMLVMYLQCLRELKSQDDYVRVALKLLTKSCASEKERLRQNTASRSRGSKSDTVDSSLKGVVGNLFDLATSLSSQVKVPLANFFSDIELAGPPQYYENRDKCFLEVNVRSLLPDEIKLDAVTLRISSTEGGPVKDLKFEKKEEALLNPGRNTIRVDCSSVVPGKYRVNHLGLSSSNLFLHFERDVTYPAARTADIFRNPEVVLYQRLGALDVQLTATKDTSLDKNNSFDLQLSTGWNSLKACEVRVKPATGGLRLLTMGAKVVDSSIELSKPPESGVFHFSDIPENENLLIRFPYSIEQDMNDVSVKLEVSYTTVSGEKYYFAKSTEVAIALALGVNVQDVFKHTALFSRFNVSTASSSPLRLFKSELLNSELFESEFGIPAADAVVIFPKQPATFLYRVQRNAGVKSNKRAAKTMYLKLYYTVLQAEIEDLIRNSILEALAETPLKQYARAVSSCVSKEIRLRLQVQDLERAALLGAVTTSFLVDAPWEGWLDGLGKVPNTQDAAPEALADFLREWQKSHPRVKIPAPNVHDSCTIRIPVEIPSLSILHTADIRLHTPLPSIIDEKISATPTVCTNQMLSATLHLKWTQLWDTEGHKGDQEFSYEVTAPTDTWLLGGRRKGHFVIPGSSSPEPRSSTPDTEAEIPLILIPLREGWLAYPTIEIREVQADAGAVEAPQACEVDWRNLGETIRVVGERRTVTVSLDASGPGGGPLVLESEGLGVEKGRIIA